MGKIARPTGYGMVDVRTVRCDDGIIFFHPRTAIVESHRVAERHPPSVLEAHHPPVDHEGAMGETFQEAIRAGIIQGGDRPILRRTQSHRVYLPRV